MAAVCLKLEDNISAHLESGLIKIVGLSGLPDEIRNAKKNEFVSSLPEIEKRLINVALSTINQSEGTIRPDGLGLHFPKSVELEAAQKAWNAFISIRPLIIKTIDLFPISGKMVRARKVLDKITVIYPDGMTTDEKRQADEVIKDFGLCAQDFGSFGGVA